MTVVTIFHELNANFSLATSKTKNFPTDVMVNPQYENPQLHLSNIHYVDALSRQNQVQNNAYYGQIDANFSQNFKPNPFSEPQFRNNLFETNGLP